MFTKTQFCKMIVNKHLREEDKEKLEDWDILQSSTLAVCMEHLGLIQSNEAKEYASTRGGIIYTYIDDESKEVHILSTRELIELLPD